jgi:hypothetical protein
MAIEDLANYLAVFGDDATLSDQAVRVVFYRPHQLAAVGQYGMASTQPAVVMATSDVPGNVVGQTLVCLGTTYVVAAHEPDGTGMSTLQLETA